MMELTVVRQAALDWQFIEIESLLPISGGVSHEKNSVFKRK